MWLFLRSPAVHGEVPGAGGVQSAVAPFSREQPLSICKCQSNLAQGVIKQHRSCCVFFPIPSTACPISHPEVLLVGWECVCRGDLFPLTFPCDFFIWKFIHPPSSAHELSFQCFACGGAKHGRLCEACALPFPPTPYAHAPPSSCHFSRGGKKCQLGSSKLYGKEDFSFK